MKSDLTKVFIDEIYSTSPRKKYPSNELAYNLEMWSIGLIDMSDYESLNNKRFGYIFFIFEKTSKHFWCIPLKKRKFQSKTGYF